MLSEISIAINKHYLVKSHKLIFSNTYSEFKVPLFCTEFGHVGIVLIMQWCPISNLDHRVMGRLSYSSYLNKVCDALGCIFRHR